MKKLNMYFTEKEIGFIQKTADESGISFAEALRRIVDEKMKGKR